MSRHLPGFRRGTLRVRGGARNTQAPLTRAGERSTDAHEVQSSMGESLVIAIVRSNQRFRVRRAQVPVFCPGAH